MSGRGKGGKVKGKAKSRSSRAGLQFPVGRIHRLLRYRVFHVTLRFIQLSSGRETMQRGWVQGHQFTWPPSWSTWLPRFLSLLAMLPGTTRSRVSSQGTFNWPSGVTTRLIICILSSFVLSRNDEELNKLLAGVTIAQGGVLPNIQAVLLPKKSASAKEKA